ncbi:MAG: (d)CMP kinase [Coraliomargaritaceae bacterium]
MSKTTSNIVIAIDGGAASGKSSTSQQLAKRFNLLHVDTGSHYRTITHALLHAGASIEDTQEVVRLLDQMSFQTRIDGQRAQLQIHEQMPSQKELRSQKVNLAVSTFAALPEIRAALFDYQRSQKQIAEKNSFAGLVMEGRDIGSVILPDADYRFYLHADESTRSARRANQGEADSIAQRDKQDQQRQAAPLTCPEGAIRIDTGKLNLNGVVEYIANIIDNA